jgi:hypothetical protein
MDEGGDEWTDEEDEEKLVKKANRVPLAELNEVIRSLVPSLSLTAKIGYSSTQPCLIQKHIFSGPVRSQNDTEAGFQCLFQPRRKQS